MGSTKEAGCLSNTYLQKLLVGVCLLFLPTYIAVYASGYEVVVLRLESKTDTTLFPPGTTVLKVSDHIFRNRSHHDLHHEVSQACSRLPEHPPPLHRSAHLHRRMPAQMSPGARETSLQPCEGRCSR